MAQLDALGIQGESSGSLLHTSASNNNNNNNTNFDQGAMSDASSSTRAPTVAEEQEKEAESTGIELPGLNGDENGALNEKNAEQVNDATDNAVEYPEGLTLFFIFLALAMSIFLASLDMVSVSTQPFETFD